MRSLDELIMDKPMRTRVGDYIDKEIEKSKREAVEEESRGTPSRGTPAPAGDKVCNHLHLSDSSSHAAGAVIAGHP